MLKNKIDATAYAALPDVLKAEYKQSGADFVLDTEEARGLQTALDSERAAREAAEKTVKDKQKEAEDAAADAARKAGDIKTLEASWQKKLDDQKTEYDGKLKIANTAFETLTVQKEAKLIATQISSAPDLLVDKIASRLRFDPANPEAAPRVVDAQGNLTALTVEDLKKEFVDNPAYKPIIIASKGDGGRPAGEPKREGERPPEGKKFSEMTAKERIAHIDASRDDADKTT